MKRVISKLLVCFFLLISSGIFAQTISPYLVGTNLWYTNPSTTVWNLTKQCGVQTIRIGGAEYDKNMPSNATILSWVKQIRAIGAEPIVQVSQYRSAAEAAALVTYLNVTNKNTSAPVKFWNIGNEPWLQAGKPAVSTAGALVEKYFKPISEAMKAVDPTIKVYGPDFCYYIDEGMNDLFGGKNNIAGKVPGKDYYYCDGISWHTYPQDNNIDLAVQGLASFNSTIVKCKQKVDAVNLLMNRTGDNALGWGIGEFNAKGGAENHTWGNGQMFGGILGLCMKYQATYATSWSMYESGGNRQGTDFSLLDGASMVPRASYRHMELVAKYFKGNYVNGISSNSDFVVYGAKSKGQVSVMIMHRGFGFPKEYKLTLDNTTPAGASYALKLDADTALTYSDMIGERTTHVIIFRGDSIIKINYTSADFDKGIAPQLSTVKVSISLPNISTGLGAVSLSFNSVNLSWVDVSDNELGFVIEREINGVFKTVAMTSANVKSYTDQGLSPQTSYKYRMAAYNSMGKSDYSDVKTVTTLETPAAKAYKGPHVLPGKIESEDFDDNGEGLSFHDIDLVNQGAKYRMTTGVDIESSTDVGLGYNLGYTATGEWLNYLIESVTPGTYDIALRMSSGSTSTAAKRIDVYIDNVKVGQVVPSITGGWQIWETKYIKGVVIKDSQPKVLKLMFTGGDFNLNWVQFGTDLSTAVSSLLGTKMNSYYNGINQQIQVQLSKALKDAHLQVFNSLGQCIHNRKFTDIQSVQINAANWGRGIYLISVSNKTERYTSKLTIY
ncbi:MAG TPA: carbohydrate-binding protein [Prolixibacteraceae bacterium]|jgi:hypothetical protein